MAGMKVDDVALEGFSDFISTELETLSEKIYAICGTEFNIGSPKQVGEILQELNIETGKKTATGQISTSKDILLELAETYEIAQFIIDYRELDKLKATYADVLPKLIDATANSRKSESNRRDDRTIFIDRSESAKYSDSHRTRSANSPRICSRKGCQLISADYSQLELRLLAHITRDERMLEAFQNGEDIHAQTAKLVFGAKTDAELKIARRNAKITNFAIAYAVEAYGLSQRVGISRVEAKKVIEDYYETYKGVKKFMDETPEVAREQGYVSSIYGRRRYFPSINDRNYKSVRAPNAKRLTCRFRELRAIL